MNKKIVFFVVWLGLLSVAFFTVLKYLPFSFAIKSPLYTSNLIQRLTGLGLFTLLFFQVVLGAFMDFWKKRLGGWIYNFHIFEGVLIYFLIFLHPVAFYFFNHYAGKGVSLLYVYTNICALCPNKLELYYTLGRVCFWLLNITVLAGLFRAATPFMRKNWRNFHVLNYLVFLVVGIHGLSLGSDFMQMPFFALAIAYYLIVLYIILFKKAPIAVKNYKEWLNS